MPWQTSVKFKMYTTFYNCGLICPWGFSIHGPRKSTKICIQQIKNTSQYLVAHSNCYHHLHTAQNVYNGVEKCPAILCRSQPHIHSSCLFRQILNRYSAYSALQQKNRQATDLICILTIISEALPRPCSESCEHCFHHLPPKTHCTFTVISKIEGYML